MENKNNAVSATNNQSVSRQDNGRAQLHVVATMLDGCKVFPSIHHYAESDLLRIMRLDAVAVSTNAFEYQLANAIIYTIALNSWNYLLLDCLDKDQLFLAVNATERLSRIIKHHGLLTIIKTANTLSDYFIDNNLFDEVEWREIDAEVLHQPGAPDLCAITRHMSADVKRLQFLRYLKRFSPDKTDLLADATIDAFLERNNSCRDINRRVFGMEVPRNESPSDWAIDTATNLYNLLHDRSLDTPKFVGRIPHNEAAMAVLNRSLFRQWVPAYDDPVLSHVLHCAARQCHMILQDYDPGDPYFSNGTINDGTRDDNRSHAAKLIAALKKDSGFLGDPSLESLVASQLGQLKPYTYVCKGLTVPKSYKIRRFIAQEEAGRAYHMQAVRIGLRRALFEHGIDLYDQGINQKIAREASVSTFICTADLHAASDSNSYMLVKNLMRYDPDLFGILTKWRGKYVNVRKQNRILHMFASSGSPECFETETLVFVSLLYGCADYLLDMDYISFDEWNLYCDLINAYGDDLVFHSDMFPFVKDVFEKLGFVINTEKSHFREDDLYRESCGVEYFNGADISNKYFPRKLLTFKGVTSAQQLLKKQPETLASLISLQHRFIDYEWTNAYLINVIRKFVPDMTESYIDSDYDDIWSADPLITYEHDPKDDNVRLVKKPYYCRPWEVHYTLTTVNTPMPKGISYDAASVLAYEDALSSVRVSEDIPCPFTDIGIIRVPLERNSSVASLAGCTKATYRKKYY